MKITKTASGKRSIKLSKNEWKSIGKKAGWIKESDEEKSKWIAILQENPMRFPEAPEELKLDKDIRRAAREFFKSQVERSASVEKEAIVMYGQHDDCPRCGSDSNIEIDAGHRTTCECPKCGKYELSREEKDKANSA